MSGNEILRLVTLSVSGLIALGLGVGAWATGGSGGSCTDDGAPRFSALIDGTTACKAVTGQVGCRISGGVGTCTFAQGENHFTAQSSRAPDGSTMWSISNATVGIDFVATGGASHGNACTYYYQYDETSGAQLGFKKSTGAYSKVTYVDVCSNLTLEEAPPEPEPPKVVDSCEIMSDTIDETGVTCPDAGTTVVCNVELTDENGDPVPFFGLNDTDSCCVCNREALDECDPNLPESEGGCPQDDPVLDPEVTTHFEFNNDPYYCTTVGGRRTCYKY